MRSAIERAQLTPLISRLPAGLDTVVGERGVKVSGGERQRLAFARLLVQQPHIVVMDEPTSSLDSITEAAVSQNLRDFLTGRTVIIIAHWLQTVQNADRILVLHEGEIVLDGDFASLVEVQGPFREMWEQQSNSCCIQMLGARRIDRLLLSSTMGLVSVVDPRRGPLSRS